MSEGAAIVQVRRVFLPPVPDGEDFYILDDHCANCLQELTHRTSVLFCSDWCMKFANTTRNARSVITNGRFVDPAVQQATTIQLGHALVGGYDAKARAVASQVRERVVQRDGGRCLECGAPANQLDHIAGPDSTMDNLQLLCDSCHRRKTMSSMKPVASPQLADLSIEWWRTRVLVGNPRLACDDELGWQYSWREWKRERGERLRRRTP